MFDGKSSDERKDAEKGDLLCERNTCNFDLLGFLLESLVFNANDISP